MTKCRIRIFGLATAFVVTTGSACAGPERTTGPEGGSPALQPMAPSLRNPGSQNNGPAGGPPHVIRIRSGFAIHNRTGADSANGEGHNPDQ